MGQKVNPRSFRLVINKDWNSKWYSIESYASMLHEDLKIRKYIEKNLANAGVGYIAIERAAQKVRIKVFTAKPGVVIGKKGAGVENLKGNLQKLTGNELSLSVMEIKKPELNAKLIAESVAFQLERRVSFRRAMKRAVASAMKVGALGIKIMCSGRLGGAEMARTEWYSEGSIPLHTLRKNIDYALVEAKTTYGIIGVKTWIHRKD